MIEEVKKVSKVFLENNITDIHIYREDDNIILYCRDLFGYHKFICEDITIELYNYLKYISNIDLGNSLQPQCGGFSIEIDSNKYYFRLAYIKTFNLETCVLRLLNNNKIYSLKDLSRDNEVLKIFEEWMKFEPGLYLFSGPTGSGKTTTMYTFLKEFAKKNKYKIMTLEDPIEMLNKDFIQIQVNSNISLSYDEIIKQVLRHDPDIIMIGEVRDEKTAKILIRAALSGHMVFSTIHAQSCEHAIKRLFDFGINKTEIENIILGITNQRLFRDKNKNKRVCLYEIFQKDKISKYLSGNDFLHMDMKHIIKKNIEENIIDEI